MLSELTALERALQPLLQGAPMQEPFFQVMCHGVPSSVKAASNGVLTALARFKDAAPVLLERLMQCAVVNEPGAGMMTAEGFAGKPGSKGVAEGWQGGGKQQQMCLSCMSCRKS
jgi:hypothetical protein